MRRDKTALALGAAVVSAGLAAGLFFAYACSVMLALHRVDDRAFVDVMQQINDVIQNPVFFAVLFGAPVLIAIAGVQQRGCANGRAARWIWAALALYVLGLLVTIGANVPLNDDLAAAGDPDRIKDLAGVRDHFEGPWDAWNIVRTILHAAALGCLAAGATSSSPSSIDRSRRTAPPQSGRP